LVKKCHKNIKRVRELSTSKSKGFLSVQGKSYIYYENTFDIASVMLAIIGAFKGYIGNNYFR